MLQTEIQNLYATSVLHQGAISAKWEVLNRLELTIQFGPTHAH